VDEANVAFSKLERERERDTYIPCSNDTNWVISLKSASICSRR
jgi:hypothetical protein